MLSSKEFPTIQMFFDKNVSTLVFILYICTWNPQGTQNILLNGLSITTREKKSNTTYIGTAPLWAQASHISCGLW
jgi:hypothetical protein